MKKLGTEEIRKALARLPGWKYGDEGLVKTFVFPAFREGMAFVARIAPSFDLSDHHPDIRISYTKITFSFRTHSADGVTEKDASGAEAVEKAYAAFIGP